MQDALRAYMELALGLSEASRKRAMQVVKSVAEQSGAKVEDLQTMAEDLLSTAVANRENVAKLIQFELDKALGKVGLATTEEVAELKARVRHLEDELRHARRQGDGPVIVPADKPVAKAAAKKTTAKKTAKKTVKKTTAKKATGGE